MRHIIRKAAMATGLGLGALALTATPALAAGPIGDSGDWDFYSSGVLRGGAHIQRISGDHYDIAVADKNSDGLRFCVRIHASNGNRPLYCDTNNVGAAMHFSIYYNWTGADIIMGNVVRPWI
ncbi:hypothetical protein Ade02nite_11860 [Paractinoplanes deccanensis]|uniref:Uncharacterized protein n=1 Tax=Paractinoplanes deccanensis TaxID=113561 RepID=A0ABQ3XXW6_9ACTN|nr:hypothetical protein [Actinoplanes deccanensis]GID72545.1 hypothetical protein Ade02nite_11860 [Actinoplanes deccanensis]